MTSPLRRALAAAIVVPAVLALGACKAEVSAGGGFDPDDLAAQVQASQEKATPGLDVTGARCADVDGNPEKGDTIDCSVKIDGVEAPYVVTVTSGDDDGAKFDLAPAKAVVSTEAAEQMIGDEYTKQDLQGVTVDCGEAAVIVQDPKTTFPCTASQGENSQDWEVTIVDIDGNVTAATV